MKKGLFLLPLAGAVLLSGCTFTLFGKEITLFEKKQESGGGSSSGSGGSSSSEGVRPSGTALAKVTMKGCADAVDTSADPLVFSHDGFSVSIASSSATTPLSQAVTNTKTYEFRVYKGMSMTFAGSSAFSKLYIKYSTWKESSGTTYFFDFTLDDAENSHNDSTGFATVSLESSTTEYAAGDAGHQVRIDYVEFFA